MIMKVEKQRPVPKGAVELVKKKYTVIYAEGLKSVHTFQRTEYILNNLLVTYL
jgi:hypothetical protein